MLDGYSNYDVTFDQLNAASDQHAVFKRSSWPASAVLQRPAPPPRFLAWFDRKMQASVAALLLICYACISVDYGSHKQLPTTTAHMSSASSTSYSSIALHSTVLEVSPSAEVLLLEVQLQQHGHELEAACRAAHAADFEVAVGTAEPAGAAPAAIIPLCARLPASTPSAGVDRNVTAAAAAAAAAAARVSSGAPLTSSPGQVYHVPIPLRLTNTLASPWEEWAADLQLSLRCAGRRCTHRNTPGISWTAHWSVPGMQLQPLRYMVVTDFMALDAAGVFPIDEAAVPHMDRLGMYSSSPDAALRLLVSRDEGTRVMHLLSAVVQLCFIAYFLLLGMGQLLWAYVVHRFLCMRVHATAHHSD